MKSTSTAFAALLLLAGCGHRLQESAPPTTGSGSTSGTTTTTGGSTGGTQPNISVNGAVEKGPFVLGSTITLSAIDASGNPTGATFDTQTTDDLGQFSLSVAYSGPVSVEAQGYYFDELEGAVSTSTLTLQGFGALPASGSAQLNVNVLTHLESARVTALMASGKSLEDASAQAQTELVGSLELGGAGFTLSEPATAASLAGGDNVGDAYLLTVSLLFMQFALDNASAADQVPAVLQELLNNARAAFATSGQLPSATVAALQRAQAKIDPYLVRLALEARYGATSGFVVPDIDQVLDSDLDGVPNALDNCPLVPNPDGGAVPGVCDYQRSEAANAPSSQPTYALFIGDIDGDGRADVLNADFSYGGSLWTGLGDGGLSAGQDLGTMNFYGSGLVDVDGDGKLDVTGMAGFGPSLPPESNYAGWLKGYGDGGFSTPNTIIGAHFPMHSLMGDAGMTTFSCANAEFADLNADGRLDAIVPCQDVAYGPNGFTTVMIALQQSDGTFAAPSMLGLPGDIEVNSMNVGDFDGDGKTDVLVSSCVDPATCHYALMSWSPTGGVWLARGQGDGTFVVDQVMPATDGLAVVAVADVDGDGNPDLVSGTGGGNMAQADVYLGDGTGHFSVASAYHLDDMASAPFAAADVTGDGKLDLVIVGNVNITSHGEDVPSQVVEIIPGTGTGWGTPQTLAAEPDIDFMGEALGDLDGHGHTDIVVDIQAFNAFGPASALEVYRVNVPGWHSW
ncbi:MAG: VCBS repeat-containing protein [Deltaproteobacteria bacterium]|nr:VCBS repeat-containing protein [Deltaproteobacteria bacterium]